MKYKIFLVFFVAFIISVTLSISSAAVGVPDFNGYIGAVGYYPNSMWDYNAEDFLYVYPGGYELAKGGYIYPEMATTWSLISRLLPFHEMIYNYQSNDNDTVPLFFGMRTYLFNYTRFVIPSYFTSYSTATNEDMVFSLKLREPITIKRGQIFEFYVSPYKQEDNQSGYFGNLILNNGSITNVDFTDLIYVIDATPSNNAGEKPTSPTYQGTLSPLKFTVEKADPYYIQYGTSGSEYLSEWYRVRSVPLSYDITITRIGFQFGINGATYKYNQINRTNISMYCSGGVTYTLPLRQFSYQPLPDVPEFPSIDEILGENDYINDFGDLGLNLKDAFSSDDVLGGISSWHTIYNELLNISAIGIIVVFVSTVVVIRALIGR